MKLFKYVLGIGMTLVVVLGCFFLPGAVAGWQESTDGPVELHESAGNSFGVALEAGASPTETAAVMESAAEPVASVSETPADVPYVSGDTRTYTVWDSASQEEHTGIDLITSMMLREKIMAQTNVQFSFRYVDESGKQEQFNLMIAAGDYPDVINHAEELYAGGAEALVTDEICYDLAPMLPELAPNYDALLGAEDVGANVFAENGVCVSFCSIYEEPWPQDSFYVLNRMMLDFMGLEVPRTLDDLEEILTASQDYGQGGLVLVAEQFPDDLLSGFGAASGMYLEGNTVHFGPLEEAYETYLKTMHQWMEEGLVELVNDAPAMPDASEDQSRCIPTSLGEVVLAEDRYGEDWLALPPLAETPEGPARYAGPAPSRVGANRWAITTACTDLEPLLRTLDYFYTSDGALLCNYGVEGETFQYDAAGQPQFLEKTLFMPDLESLIFAEDTWTFRSVFFLMDLPTAEQYGRQLGGYQWERLVAVRQEHVDYSRCIPAGVTMTRQEAEGYAAYMNDIMNYVRERTVRFLEDGGILIEYEMFREELLDMGAGTCIELMQEAVDRYLNR